MLRIAIAGCGEIGSRHLQALAQLEESASILLIDPSSDAIATAKSRFEDRLPSNARGLISIRECQIDEVGSEVDVAIISSSSSVRASLTRELLKNTQPKYIIFEKFLFTEKSDYDVIGSLLREHNIKAWVNQWMSSSYAFRRMANWLTRESPISVEVSGDEWGLACNAVHFIDLFDYINGRGTLTLNSCILDDGMLPGKRVGYFEVTGKIAIWSANDAMLEMVSHRAKSNGLTSITMQSNKRMARAVLAIGKVSCDYIDGAKIVHEDYIVPMQSNTTEKIVQSLMLSGECELPKFDRSVYQHKLILGCIDSHFREKCNWISIGCPIT
jgi:hypothetical protein